MLEPEPLEEPEFPEELLEPELLEEPLDELELDEPDLPDDELPEAFLVVPLEALAEALADGSALAEVDGAAELGLVVPEVSTVDEVVPLAENPFAAVAFIPTT